MMDEQGEPLLMDFGLAARAEGDEKLTQEATAMGTPAYMAPEQTAGKAEAASDQYSLGCAFYELLTGQTPFSGPPELQIFLHQTQEAPSPRKIIGQIPRDLETICLKCLAKKPAERYTDCRGLADDLRRWLEGEPIATRRLGVAERLMRWTSKEPKLAAALSLAFILLVVVAIVLAVGEQQQHQLTETARGEASAKQSALTRLEAASAAKAQESAAKEAAQKDRIAALEKGILNARTARYSRDIAQAWAQCEAFSLQAAEDTLDSCPWDLVGWEWYFLKEWCRRNPRLFAGPSQAVTAVAFRADGLQMVGGSEDGSVRVWDPRSGEELCVLKFEAGGVTAVAFSPDGRFLAAAGKKGPVQLWDVRSGEALLKCEGQGGSISSLSFAPDSRQLASGSDDGTIALWDPATGKRLREIKGEGLPVLGVAFHPRGEGLVERGRQVGGCGSRVPLGSDYGGRSSPVPGPAGRRQLCRLQSGRPARRGGRRFDPRLGRPHR